MLKPAFGVASYCNWDQKIQIYLKSKIFRVGLSWAKGNWLWWIRHLSTKPQSVLKLKCLLKWVLIIRIATERGEFLHGEQSNCLSPSSSCCILTSFLFSVKPHNSWQVPASLCHSLSLSLCSKLKKHLTAIEVIIVRKGVCQRVSKWECVSTDWIHNHQQFQDFLDLLPDSLAEPKLSAVQL